MADEVIVGKPRLLERVSMAIRARHYSRRTEEAYVFWIRKFILFHQKRHPSEMGAPDISMVSVGSTMRIWPPGWDASPCPRRWRGSSQGPPRSGAGSSCFRRAVSAVTNGGARRRGTTFTSR
jgi:hypothetical protein